MTANKAIIVSVSLYIVLFIIATLVFLNTKFTGSDAAGNGMAQGLTFFYGLGVLFVIALVPTLINAFFFKNISQQWIKFLFFIPLLLPLLVFSVEYFELGRSRVPSIAEQAHRLTIQIRATENLENPRFAFRSSKGGSFSKLTFKKMEGNYHFYENSNAIFFETDRKFHVSSNQFQTQKQFLEIPYELKPTAYSNWENLSFADDAPQDLKLEFRYAITKSRRPQ